MSYVNGLSVKASQLSQSVSRSKQTSIKEIRTVPSRFELEIPKFKYATLQSHMEECERARFTSGIGCHTFGMSNFILSCNIYGISETSCSGLWIFCLRYST